MNLFELVRKKKRLLTHGEMISENTGFSDSKNQLTHKNKIVTIDTKGKLSELLPEQVKKRKTAKRSLNLVDLNIGFYIITPILLGVVIGIAMDNWLGRKPFFVSWGIILGTIGSFYNLISFMRKDG